MTVINVSLLRKEQLQEPLAFLFRTADFRSEKMMLKHHLHGEPDASIACFTHHQDTSTPTRRRAPRRGSGSCCVVCDRSRREHAACGIDLDQAQPRMAPVARLAILWLRPGGQHLGTHVLAARRCKSDPRSQRCSSDQDGHNHFFGHRLSFLIGD